MDYSIRIKIFVFSVTAVYIRHPFFPGCHSFRSGPISPLGRNLKLQMLELETCGGGCSGENWAAWVPAGYGLGALLTTPWGRPHHPGLSPPTPIHSSSKLQLLPTASRVCFCLLWSALPQQPHQTAAGSRLTRSLLCSPMVASDSRIPCPTDPCLGWPPTPSLA